MPHHPKKRSLLKDRKRPGWNQEPDYWFREKLRLEIVEDVKRRADSFTELSAVCPGCGHHIWQASVGTLVYRGCHCMTFMYPPGHPLYEFHLDLWSAAVNLYCQSSSPGSNQESSFSGES
jgi:hypothetical protein